MASSVFDVDDASGAEQCNINEWQGLSKFRVLNSVQIQSSKSLKSKARIAICMDTTLNVYYAYI